MTWGWRDAPRHLRLIAAVVVIILAYGTAVHLVHLVTTGFNPYPATATRYGHATSTPLTTSR